MILESIEMTEVQKAIAVLILQFCKESGMDDKIKSHSDKLIDHMAIDMVVKKIPKSFCLSYMTEFVEKSSNEILQYCSQSFDMNDVVNFLTSNQMQNQEMKMTAFNQFMDKILDKNSQATLSSFKQDVEQARR